MDIVGENYVSPNQITDQCLFTDVKRLAIDPTGDFQSSISKRVFINKCVYMVSDV